jgi:hypothetical protein
MNSPQETQLSHDLHRLASGQPFTPGLAEIKQLARQRHRRSLMRRGATAAGALVLAGGGLFFGVHGFSGDHGTAGPAAGIKPGTRATAAPSRSASAGPTTGTETVAYVAARVEAALASVNGDVIRDDQAFTGITNDSGTNWTDSRTGNEFESMTGSKTGQWLAWLSTGRVNGVLTAHQVVADYSTRTWYAMALPLTGTHSQGPSVNESSPVMTPAEIKTWLDSGQAKIVGHQRVNGQDTIVLRGPWILGYRELWVDSQTFLPVRVFVDYYANQGTPSQDLKFTGNLTWLPRTQSLANMVNQVHIPAGFKQVAPPQ